MTSKIRPALICWRKPPVDLRHKPLYPAKPLQPPRGKAVTIVVGFRCTNGIVMCADRQVTGHGAFKYHEPKISAEQFDTFTALFGYAGDPSLAREVHDKICAVLRNTPLPNQIVGSVRDITEAVLSGMERWYTGLDLEMLIAVNSWEEGTDLLKFSGKAVYIARDFEYLAFGDSSLIRYLADKLYTKRLDVNAGADLAIYMVKKAEDYIDGCGGPIDVAVLEPTDRSYKRLSQGFIDQCIAKMEAQEKLLLDLLIRKPFSST